MDILVVNSGSSSIKVAVIASEDGTRRLTGLAERLGTPEAVWRWSATAASAKSVSGEVALGGAGADQASTGDHAAALRAVFATLSEQHLDQSLSGIGHRVVHGGAGFSDAVLVDAAVVSEIAACARLAPLHNPPNQLGIETCQQLLPDLPNAAVFDTAFHATMPEAAWRYAVPDELYREHGVRRYGFHGTSHQFVAETALAQLGLSDDPAAGLVTCHLGNGCSAAAVLGGRSVDTTMGLTPLEGLVMGTRSGDVDPALPGFLCQQLGWSIDQVTAMLNKQSGLLGLSGRSNDMRTVSEAAAAGDAAAECAVAVFCYRLAKAIGALAVPLGRLDAIVFTGGIGEHAAPIRARVCAQLGVFGVALDADRNATHGRAHGGRITTDASATAALVVATDEELMIARQTAALITA